MITDRVNLIPAAYLPNKWGPPLSDLTLDKLILTEGD